MGYNFNWVAREDLMEKLTFEQRGEGGERVIVFM